MNTPIPNSYWVETGSLLAGEYPGMRSEHLSKAKLAKFLDSGVTFFIDLTEAGELRPYEPDLERLAEDRAIDVCYRRFPIRDGGGTSAPE